MNSIAFVPARAGSKRVKNKNILKLGDHPLLSYAIVLAKKSKLFDKVICITDSKKYLKIAKHYGADNFKLRPKKISGSKSPDIEWIKWALKRCKKDKINFKYFAILRPTNPFRTVKMLKNAYNLLSKEKIHSVRGVELTPIHPGKIWSIKKNLLIPIINKNIKGTPWHSCQYDALPNYYSQNASLEFCRKDNIRKFNTFSGKKIAPLLTKQYEGFDINSKMDVIYAKKILQKNQKYLNIFR